MFLVYGRRTPRPVWLSAHGDRNASSFPQSSWESCSFTRSCHRQTGPPARGTGGFHPFCGFKYWVEKETDSGWESKLGPSPPCSYEALFRGSSQFTMSLVLHAWKSCVTTCGCDLCLTFLGFFVCLVIFFLPEDGEERGRPGVKVMRGRLGKEVSNATQWLLSPCEYIPSEPALGDGRKSPAESRLGRLAVVSSAAAFRLFDLAFRWGEMHHMVSKAGTLDLVYLYT